MSQAHPLVSRAEDVAWVSSPERVALLRLDALREPPVVLEGAAGVIWECLVREMPLESLVTAVGDAFNVAAASIHDEVAAFVADCVGRHLMRSRSVAT